MIRSIAPALTAAAALLLVGPLSGCDVAARAIDGIGTPPSNHTAQPAGGGTAREAAQALVQLDSIPVKGRAPKTGYTRDEFGPAWADTDRNGCDTRNDILARDLTGETFKPGTSNCVVLTGTLADKYTGTTINFVRGQGTSSAVQIDHVVALSDAWQKGAQQLSADQRKELANDPLNLMAADGPTNGAKGDKDAATWLPPNKAFRCEYVTRQAAVKAKYHLWVTRAEHDAIGGILQGCR
ncbi:HNH endonuclease family protein [Pseudarthrobacter sp. 1G09]|uniref:HNH endonuclease family protein n=1 Tax=Pseudarthrobacter sp. 1G09 TaxID=3416178 RepID=UPI003CED10FC